MSHQRLTMLISGKVQGVCYRASAADMANSLGVTGYRLRQKPAGWPRRNCCRGLTGVTGFAQTVVPGRPSLGNRR